MDEVRGCLSCTYAHNKTATLFDCVRARVQRFRIIHIHKHRQFASEICVYSSEMLRPKRINVQSFILTARICILERAKSKIANNVLIV